MNIHFISFFTALFLLISGLLIPQSSFAQYYAIDPEHSRVEFKVKHMGIGWVTGEFREFSGNFAFDPKNLAKSYVEATIKATSIDSNTEKRDKHLKSAAFLDTLMFKNIRFLSNKIDGENPENFKLKGVLTIKSTSREVILDVHHSGSLVDPWGVQRASFQATTTINRKDFGLTWNRLLETGALLVGEEVLITLDIQGVEVKDNTPKLIDPSLMKNRVTPVK